MKRRKTNYFYSIVSVALVLFLLGFFGTALLFTRQQVVNQQEKISMMVELKENSEELALDMLKTWLPKAEFAREVRFVSKEQAATMMRKSLGDEYIAADMPLPFYDAYSINLKVHCLTTDSIAAISARLRTNEAVSDVYMDEGLMGDVSGDHASIIALPIFTASWAYTPLMFCVTSGLKLDEASSAK